MVVVHPSTFGMTNTLFEPPNTFLRSTNPVASVCHGVEIPAYADCVRGRRMATVPKCKFDLEVCGGIFVNEACVIDGNLVSGRTFHDNGHYVGPWIKLLGRSTRGITILHMPELQRISLHTENSPNLGQHARKSPRRFSYRRFIATLQETFLLSSNTPLSPYP